MSDGDVLYMVVRNHEEQYSIWPVGLVIPHGWQTIGEAGTREECLSHIEAVWTDMRPLSLRKQMATHLQNATDAAMENRTSHA